MSEERLKSHLLQGKREQAGQTWREEDTNSGNQVPTEGHCPVSINGDGYQ